MWTFSIWLRQLDVFVCMVEKSGEGQACQTGDKSCCRKAIKQSMIE